MIRQILKIPYDRFNIGYYKLSGRKPWSRGYSTFKFSYIKNVLSNKGILKLFKNSKILPEKFGYLLDERAIEYPWVLSRLTSAKDMILDAGSVLNYEEILNFERLNNKNLTILNLAPEAVCFWKKRVSYIFSDIRSLPFKDNYFDIIVCISTLEHIGMDNSRLTKDKKHKENKILDFNLAILELKRVLKDNGILLITVPFGKYQNFGHFQQFNPDLIDMILKSFKPRKEHIDYYMYKNKGWNICNAISCKNLEHSNLAMARAVACLELIK